MIFKLFSVHKNCTATVETLQLELQTCRDKCTNLKHEITDLSTQLQEQKAIYHYQTMELEDKIKLLEGKLEKPCNLSNKIYYWKNKYERLVSQYRKLQRSSKIHSQNLSVSDSSL